MIQNRGRILLICLTILTLILVHVISLNLLSTWNSQLGHAIQNMSREISLLKYAIQNVSRENSHLKYTIQDMTRESSNLKYTIQDMARENSNLKDAIINMTSDNSQPKDMIQETALKVNTNVNATVSKAMIMNRNARKFFPSMVTICLLKSSDETAFQTKLAKIKTLYPTATIKSADGQASIAHELNRILSEVQTEYFVLLEADVSFSNRATEGISTLWDALERHPDIDFIGGSYLSDDKFYITCQRFKFCRWTFSESYEYERSLENLMICDGTSASFMGRTKSVRKVEGGFDEKISNILVVKDFFVRAKATRNVIVATRPSFILLVDQFRSLYDSWKSADIARDLISFAVKHKVFIFKDEEGNIIDLCSPTSSLSGKELCIESNAHNLMLDGGHWAYQGLYTYPFLLGYLKVTLKEVTNFFERHNVEYVVKGGVSLGAVKMHSVLPWEAGDLDIHLYGMNVTQLLKMLQPWAAKMGYVVREHAASKAVHVFCTPKEIGDLSGGLATIFPTLSSRPAEYMRIRTNGLWVRYPRDLFQVIIRDYSNRYLEHKLYRSKNTVKCEKKGHNACLPNFNVIFNGKGGTYREYFCER